MDWERIEERLSQHLESETHPIDTDALWGAIEPHIPKKKQKYRLWFFLIPGILLLVSGAFYLGFTMASSSDKPVNKRDLVEQVATSLKSSNQNLTVRTRNTEDQEITNKTNSDTVENSLGQTTENESPPISKQSKHKLKETSRTITNNQKQNIAIISVPSNINQKADDHSHLYDASDADNSVHATLDNNYLEKSVSTISTANLNRRINLIMLGQNIQPFTIDQRKLQDPPKNAWLKSTLFAKKRGVQVYAELYGGFTILSGTLGLGDLELSEDWNNRQAAESKLISLSGGFKFGINLNRHWSIQTGLVGTQLYKRSRSSLQFTREIMLDDAVIQELFTPTGIQQIRGSIAVVESVSQQVNRINRYQQLLLPVSVLYRNRIAGLFYDIELGGATSLTNDYSGYIHPNSETEYSISDDIENRFKDGSNQYILSGIGLAYPLSNSLELNGRMSYCHHLNKLNSASYGIDESLSFLQLQIGLRYHF